MTQQLGILPTAKDDLQPSGSPVAKLIFVHGFSDHVGRYYELFPTLASRGILVIGFDQRGFGQSIKKDSEKGLTGPTAQVLSDLVEVIRSELPSPVPLFLMGHSMGGGEVLTLASTPEYEELMPQIRGLILESPLIALAFKPNFLTVFAGRLAGKVLPHRQLLQPIPAKDLSRDPKVIASLESDKMCDGTGTLEMFANMLDRAANLESGKLKLSKGVQSIWLGHGTKDLATSYAASKKWCEEQTSVKDCTFKSYDGWYHQLHADLPETQVEFAKDVGDWILEKCNTTTGTQSETRAANTSWSAIPPVGEQAKL